jgi:hypothetical protein
MTVIPQRAERDASIMLARRLLIATLRPVLAGQARAARSVVTQRLAQRLHPASPVPSGAWGIVREGIAATALRLWQRTTQAITDGYRQEARLASEQVRELAGRLSMPEPAPLTDAQAQAFAREHARITRHGATLSMRVYRNQLAHIRRVRALVDQAITESWPVDRLAREVHALIDPGTPGGVSYAAYRLAQTELTGAWFTRTREEHAATGWIEAVHWRLSRRHEVPDECDTLAERGPYGVRQVPDRPHSLCGCWTEPDVDLSITLGAARLGIRA